MKALKTRHKELLDNLTERLADILLGEKIPLDIVESQGGALLIPAYRKITKSLLREVARNWRYIEIDPSPIRNRILSVVFRFEQDLEEVEAAIAAQKSK